MMASEATVCQTQVQMEDAAAMEQQQIKSTVQLLSHAPLHQSSVSQDACVCCLTAACTGSWCLLSCFAAGCTGNDAVEGCTVFRNVPVEVHCL